MGNTLLGEMKARRSVYALTNASPVAEGRIVDLVRCALREVPSAFNCQSARAVILFGSEHRRVWELLQRKLADRTPMETLGVASQKVNGFLSGYGTILFYDDSLALAELARQHPGYARNFPIWSEQAAGMLQYAVWLLLNGEGLGANLQHYNELIEEDLRSMFHIPLSWRLIAQMPFGTPENVPKEEKKIIDPEHRMMIFR